MEEVHNAGNENMPPLPEGGAMPSLDELLSALEKLDLPEAERESLRDSLMGRTKLGEEAMKNMFKNPGMDIMPDGNPLMFYTFILALIIILTMFVFFGYKLYKSLVDKQKQREMKKMKKEMRRRK